MDIAPWFTALAAALMSALTIVFFVYRDVASLRERVAKLEGEIAGLTKAGIARRET